MATTILAWIVELINNYLELHRSVGEASITTSAEGASVVGGLQDFEKGNARTRLTPAEPNLAAKWLER